jgi:hypothetical protein
VIFIKGFALEFKYQTFKFLTSKVQIIGKVINIVGKSGKMWEKIYILEYTQTD